MVQGKESKDIRRAMKRKIGHAREPFPWTFLEALQRSESAENSKYDTEGGHPVGRPSSPEKELNIKKHKKEFSLTLPMVHQ